MPARRPMRKRSQARSRSGRRPSGHPDARGDSMRVTFAGRFSATAFLLATLCLAVYACSDTPTELLPPSGFQTVSGTGADAGAACSPVLTVPLLADGGAIEVGSVRVANDEADVFVTFETTDGWEITTSHLFVGDEGDRIPITGGGTPQVGRFPWASDHVGGATSYTYAVSRADFDAVDLLTVAAHADVRRGEQMEGAWADGDPIGSERSWATAFSYDPVECASELVTVAEGGVLTLDAPLGPVELSVPPGAVSSDVQITVEVVDASTLSLPSASSSSPSAAPTPEGPAASTQLGSVVVMGDYAYDFGPDGFEFQEPVTLTLPYDELDLPEGAVEEDVRMFVINGIFDQLESIVDVGANTVSAHIEHFSNYFPGVDTALEVDLALITLDEPAGPFEVGEVVEYGAQVQNLGPDDVPEARFTWTAFGDVTLDGVFGAACSEIPNPAGVAVECTLAAIAAGNQRGIPVLRFIPQSEGDVEVWGTVQVPLDVNDPDSGNNREIRVIAVGPAVVADLAVTEVLEPTGPFKVGQVIEYGATVGNLGPDDVPGATFTWVGFGDVTLDGVFGLCSEVPNPVVGTVAVSCPLAAIAAGAFRGIPVFRIVPQSTNPVTIRGAVTGPEGADDPNPDNNGLERTPSIDPLVADVFPSLILDSPDPVPEGEVVGYRVYAQSEGTGDDLPRALIDLQVDGDAELVSMPTGAGVACDDFSSSSPSAVYVRCEIAPLQAGIASPALDLEVRALSGPSLQARAEMPPIASLYSDPDLSNNVQNETTTVSPPPSGATAYVAVQGSDQVQAVSAATNAVVATMATGDGPYGMALRPGTDELWVTNRAGQSITRMSTSSNTVIGTIPTQQLLRGDLYDVAFSLDGGTAYVTVNEAASNAPRVTVLNAATGQATTNIILSQALPREIRVHPNGTKAYVATSEGVSVLDLATNTVATSVPATGGALGLTIAADGSAVYFTQRFDAVTGLLREIDPATDGLVGGGIPVGIEPNGVVLSPDGTTAYVAEGRARVFVVDLIGATSSSISTGVGTAPLSIDLTSDGTLLFVTDRDGAQVLEIDLATFGITPTAVGSFPAEVVIRN